MKRWKDRVLKLASITFAVFLVAACVNMFFAPHQITAGGVTGLAIIFEAWFGFNRATVILVSNAILVAMTLIFLERKIFFNTLYGAALLPTFTWLVPRMALVDDAMLSMIVGSVLLGIAVTILFRNNATGGGSSVPPLIMKKYWGLDTAIGMFFTDGIIVVLNLFVFGTNAFFFAIFAIFIISATMNYIESGFNKKKMVYIISDQHEAITHDVLHKIKKGVTIMPVIGAYEQREMKMLMVTLDTKQYKQLKVMVQEHDDQAFMITDTVSDVHGKGFTFKTRTV